ncbi:hypothetical protein H6P81_019354 [Aristolochia fimbriata]|uniref:F-box domain-containing protein n=1 Tax=Aristolochia fimbriata TaxID=158543 RepID=A0AAV7DRJ1_ARIFI|nr:hypothetical protein H6P81_019354 [Aristolochia fimbriata]
MEVGPTKIAKGYGDRISTLPEPILLHILSFLPTKFSIRTSVLSKRWRYLWTYVPTLDFDDSEAPFFKEDQVLLDMIFSPAELYLIEDKERDERFAEVVDEFLMLRNRIDIHKFRLWYSGNLFASRLRVWFKAAGTLNTKELDIGIFKRKGPFDLPLAVFGTKSLETLKLDLHFSRLRTPSNARFHRLKILQLVQVIFSSKYFHEEFFSNCPTLENLTLRTCGFTGSAPLNIVACGLKTLDIYECQGLRKCEMKLRAPNLVTFSYVLTSIAKNYDLSDLVSLAYAKVQIHKECDVQIRKKSQGNCSSLSQMISGLHAAKVLSICGSSIEMLAAEKDLLPPYPMFQNLERLNLIAYLCSCYDYMEAVDWFFSQCPNLNKLVIDDFERKSKHMGGLLCCTRRSASILPSTMNYLKEIEIKQCKTDPHAMKLMSLLEKKSPFLKKTDNL